MICRRYSIIAINRYALPLMFVAPYGFGVHVGPLNFNKIIPAGRLAVVYQIFRVSRIRHVVPKTRAVAFLLTTLKYGFSFREYFLNESQPVRRCAWLTAPI